MRHRAAPADLHEASLRDELLTLVESIDPWDDLERRHVAVATEWITGGAPLYRLEPPDEPPMHLVSYFVVFDDRRGKLLLVDHRKAGLWLPPGVH